MKTNKEYIYYGVIAILIGIVIFLTFRTSNQSNEITYNNQLIKDYGLKIDSLRKEEMRKDKLLSKGLAREDSIEKVIAKTDSFNLILKKKIRQYEKPDYSHLTSDSAILLLSNRANRYRSIK